MTFLRRTRNWSPFLMGCRGSPPAWYGNPTGCERVGLTIPNTPLPSLSRTLRSIHFSEVCCGSHLKGNEFFVSVGVPRDSSLEASKTAKTPEMMHLGCLLVLAWGETTNRTMADGREWYSCRTIRCGSGSWQDCGTGLWNRRQAHGVLAVQRQYSFRRQPEVTKSDIQERETDWEVGLVKYSIGIWNGRETQIKLNEWNSQKKRWMDYLNNK